MTALPISLLYKITNREHRRKATAEAERILPKLYEIEQKFLVDLFGSESDYSEIYTHWLDAWHELIDWMKKYGKLKYMKINEEYFVERYYPEEG